jgi:hypothetical protein
VLIIGTGLTEETILVAPSSKCLRVVMSVCVVISLACFQGFDQKKEVEANFPSKLNLRPGDRFNWICAQFSGTGEVLRRNGSEYVVRKRS